MANVRESRLTFVRDLDKHNALYLCSCGNEKKARKWNVIYGKTKSCGCLYKGHRDGNQKHSLRYHPLYGIFATIKSRCYNPHMTQYKDYGGRGVTICTQWLNDFESFYNWAIAKGWQKGSQIDKDLKGGLIYSPENCTIVNSKQNNNKKRSNRILEFNGKSQTLTLWSREMNLPRAVIRHRLDYLKWSTEISLTTSYDGPQKRKGKQIEYNGTIMGIPQWAKQLGVERMKFHHRLKNCNYDLFAYFEKWGAV